MNLHKYFEFQEGTVPIVFTCVHGGYKKPRFLPHKTQGPKIPDYNTYFLSKVFIEELGKLDIHLFYVLNKLHRSKIDLNRPKNSLTALNHQKDQNKIASRIHDYFHGIIEEYCEKVLNRFNKCLFIDFHGFSKPTSEYPDIIFGNMFGNTISILETADYPHSRYYWGLTELIESFSPNFSIDDGLGSTDFNLAFSGGYITYKFYNRSLVNALQIEVAKYIRFDEKLSKMLIKSFMTGVLKCLYQESNKISENMED